tara:strand:+ start:8234 stop:8542 length:309 start_codon:yes stop_codon:yes gene_type:complete
LLAVIFFGLLYYLQDYFITNYSKLAKKLKIIPEDYDASHDIVNNMLYYLWFSLITQTTVGYSGLVNERTNQVVPWNKINYRTYKIINVTQLLSIFYISAILL